MKVYLDVFFLVNAGMDFLALTLLSFFQTGHVSLRRRFLASLTGAALALFLCLSHVHRWRLLFLILYLAGSVLIVRAAFGKTSAAAMVKNLLFFYLGFLVLAGGLYRIRVLVGRAGSFLSLLFGACAILGVFYHLLPRGKKWMEKRRLYFSVKLTDQGRVVRGDGLLDSGNHLKDPFSGEPVAVAEKDFLAPLWRGLCPPLFRYIPFRTVGQEEGVIPVFRCAGLDLLDRNGKWQPMGDSWIAVCEHALSVDGEYNILLHPDMKKQIELGG